MLIRTHIRVGPTLNIWFLLRVSACLTFPPLSASGDALVTIAIRWSRLLPSRAHIPWKLSDRLNEAA